MTTCVSQLDEAKLRATLKPLKHHITVIEGFKEGPHNDDRRQSLKHVEIFSKSY